MSQQAGIWHYDRRPIPREQLLAFERQVQLQGPDRASDYHEPGFAMIHRAFHVTAEDRFETQPIHNESGDIITWDGRIDNRHDLLAALNRTPLELPTDAELVGAAIAAWDTDALPRILGDWALVCWNPRTRRLILACDYIGMRKLYYLRTSRSIYWSTDLSALVLHTGERFTPCDSYFAGYFSQNPEPYLTPYSEIQLVGPGRFLELTTTKCVTHTYWSFNTLPDTRYKRDTEYEEHFRYAFRQSVKHRMRTVYPLLADLSGGLDSSSIVCMAHDILKKGEAKATFDTVSFFSTDEPGADERPYFTAVEEFTCRTGLHLEANYNTSELQKLVSPPYFAPLPGYFDRHLQGELRLRVGGNQRAHRVRLKGLGGDELLGGVPNPIPDLATLLWQLRIPSVINQLPSWALKNKTSVWSMLIQLFVELAPIALKSHPRYIYANGTTDWLSPAFVRKEKVARRKLRVVPSTRDWLPGPCTRNSQYLALASSIAGYLPRFTFAEQVALPYYDRDLVQFLLTIPGSQLLRPNQRRSLMRRSLEGLVPSLVLNRKTKWLGRRVPARLLMANAEQLLTMLQTSAISRRYVDYTLVKYTLDKLRQGLDVKPALLERLLGVCLFYDDLCIRNLWASTSVMVSERYSC